MLASCHTPCISFPHSCADLLWVRGQHWALLCRVDPLKQEAAPGRAMALQAATSVLAFQGFDFQPGWQQWGLNYLNYLLVVKALCSGHSAGSSCDA